MPQQFATAEASNYVRSAIVASGQKGGQLCHVLVRQSRLFLDFRHGSEWTIVATFVRFAMFHTRAKMVPIG